METALIILIVAGAFFLVSKRFKNLIRNDFYLEKPDLSLQEKCTLGDRVKFSIEENRGHIAVFCKEMKIGYVPEDYQKVVLRKLTENPEATGKLVTINKAGYKIFVEMKGEIRDIVK